MHASSLENLQKCHDRYVVPAGLADREQVSVLDIGGANVNGSYRDVFSGPQYQYRAADIAAGEGVDIVLDDPYHVPLADASVDIVLSGQMLEHCEYFWLAFQEMVRLVKPDGFIFLIAPSAGPIHRYPVDCYRFYPDAYAALAKLAGCHLQAVWQDERGPWQDLVGVFARTPRDDANHFNAGSASLASRPAVPTEFESRPEEEAVSGAGHYLDALRRIHEVVAPERYLEIGVRHGRSLALAQCPAVGVDPAPEIGVDLPPTARVIETTSDHFFEELADDRLPSPPGLVFIDGMHLFEYVLRDFMHVERRAGPGTLVVIDDIFPNHPAQAARGRRTRVWTGDVWKLYLCLRENRPDLSLLALDTEPTGLLLISGLDPHNRVLWERYNPLVKQYRDALSEVPPDSILRREGAMDPSGPALEAFLSGRPGVPGPQPPPLDQGDADSGRPPGLVSSLRALFRRDAPRD
jgi:hypothetical protein